VGIVASMIVLKEILTWESALGCGIVLFGLFIADYVSTKIDHSSKKLKLDNQN
jgi:drug/metabolite transporter (DMT)-like permease